MVSRAQDKGAGKSDIDVIPRRTQEAPYVKMTDLETRPLLGPSPTSSNATRDNGNTSYENTNIPSRTLEDDVLTETATYGRNLTWSGAYVLVISRVLGSGIFATPGSITKSVGSTGLSLILWVAGGILAACGLAVSLEYGCMLPRSGGEKVYLEFTYRWPRFLASTLVAVQAVLLSFTASNCIVFGRYVVFAFGVEDPAGVVQKVLAVGLLSVITGIHAGSVRMGIWIQNALGWVKIGLIVFMIFSGLYVVVLRPENDVGTTPGFSAFAWDHLFEDSNWSLGVVTTALFKVFYSYAGLSNVNNVLNEVRDPVRTLKSVGPTALFTACILYLLVNVAYFVVVPLDEIKASGELIAALFFEKVFGPGLGRVILPLAVAISAAGNVMVVTFALARVNQEIARQGFLPWASLLSSSRPFNSPLGGLLVHYIPSLLVITLPPPGDVYAFILDVEGYPGQFAALATSFGIIYLRHKRPDLKRPFRAWLPAVWLRIAVCLVLIAAPFFRPKDGKGDVDFFYATYALVGIALIIFAILYWYIWFVALPSWKGQEIEEKTELLEDGTSITTLLRVKVQ